MTRKTREHLYGRRPMIIIQIAGGLGNQMQQYALYRKLLRAGADKDVKLDISWFDEGKQKDVLAKRKLELELFKGLPIPACTKEELSEFTDRGFLTKVVNKIIPSILINQKFLNLPPLYH